MRIIPYAMKTDKAVILCSCGSVKYPTIIIDIEVKKNFYKLDI